MSGSLGLGSSRSSNQSQSQSSGYGYSGSTSTNNSVSSSDSFSSGQSSTTQNIAFEQLFQQLYGNASGAAGRAAANAGQLSEVATSLFSGGTRYLEGLGQDAGSDYLEQRLSAENPVLQDQIDLLREDTGRLFSEELNPAITSRAVAGGTLGGGRQGVAQGQAMDVASRRFTEGATALRAADITARDAAARDVMQGSLAAASTGLGSLNDLLDLSERGSNQELGVYGQLSQILGGPTVLSQSRSNDYSRSTAESIAQALSSAFGEDWNSSTSSSSGRSRAWNIEGGGGVGYSGG